MKYASYFAKEQPKGLLHKLFCLSILIPVCIFMLAGCAGESTDAGDAPGNGDPFVADKTLDQYRSADIYQRVVSEPMGADPLQFVFFNQDVVCLLNYNGLLIFDSQTGRLKDGIDVKGLGFQATQGDSAMVIRGNDDFITITTMDDPEGYIYEIASQGLGKLGETDEISYTEVKVPEQNIAQRLGLAGFGGHSEISILESKDGAVAFHIPLHDLSQMKFRFYDADDILIHEALAGE